MKSKKKSPSNPVTKTSLWLWLAIIALLVYVVLITNGCGTVRPVVVESPAASWDGTNYNSGFIGWTNGLGIITAHARDRYNGLISTYGKRFNPPLSADYGIQKLTGETPVPLPMFTITPEALSDFARMNRWRKTEAK